MLVLTFSSIFLDGPIRARVFSDNVKEEVTVFIKQVREQGYTKLSISYFTRRIEISFIKAMIGQ